MKKHLLFIIGLFTIISSETYTQPSLQWAVNYNGYVSATDRLTDADYDPVTGNTYVTGVSDSTVGSNYVIIKYAPNGQVIWRNRYYGPQFQDSPNAIKYDPVNNAVYVTGKSRGNTTNYDWLTIRYNANTGDTLWTKRYNGTRNGDDEAIDIDIDATGNIYVVGNVLESDPDYLNTKFIKYSPTGAVLWTKSILTSVWLQDYPVLASKIAVNGNKLVVIYRELYSIKTAYVRAYYISNGNCIGQCDDMTVGIFLPQFPTYDVAFDGLGNVYVCGVTGTSTGENRIYVVKLNATLESQIWLDQYLESPGGSSWAKSLVVDQNNYNVYVTGYSKNISGNNDFITIKYNNTGDIIWTKIYDGSGSGDDSGIEITKDNLSNPNLYITGYTTQTNGKKQITTIKYDNNGNQLWTTDYGCGTNDNIPIRMFRDPNDIITIAGYNNCNNSSEDYLTLRYCTLPGQAGTISGNVAVCPGTTQTYSVSPVAGATSYIWTLPIGWNGSSTTNSIVVNYSTSALSGSMSVKGHNDCGDGTASALAITVNPLPSVAGVISGSSIVCQGQNSITYTVPAITNATSYGWTLPNGATGASTTNTINVNYGITATSGNISVKGINACGDGTASALAITVNPLPSAAGVISGNSIVCQGQNSVNYTVATIANATSYVWTLPNGAVGSSTTNNITVDYSLSSTSGNITVKGVNSCGYGAFSTLPITVNPLPMAAGVISGSAIVCQGQNAVIYNVPAVPNATSYVWTLPNGASGTSTSNSISVNFGSSASSGNITVKGTNSCGDGTASALAITVNPLPSVAGVISGSTIVCQGQNSITYTVPAIANATSYWWTLPNGATGASTTNTINVNYGITATSGNISVKGINVCGDGTGSALAITVNPLPSVAGVISGNSIVCQGQNSVNYTVATIANATSYVWTLPNGAVGSSTTNNITVDYSLSSTSGNITVKGVNSCGDGDVSTLPITVNEKPSTPVITLNGFVLQSDSELGNQWYDQNGMIMGATDQSYNVVSNGNYYVIVTLLGCSSESSNIISIINVGINSNEKTHVLNLYPNPVTGDLTIEIADNNEKLNFEIINALGQTIYAGELLQKVIVKTHNFTPGVYIVKLGNGKTIQFKKIIKE